MTKNNATNSTALEQTATTGRRPSVCIIEDDGGIREVLRTLLEDDGYQVLEAVDGMAGLAVLRGHPERLVALVDHKLPAMDGCDLLDIVAADEGLRARHAFIMVTGNPQQAVEDCGETIDDLDASVVSKPFDIDHVLEAVQHAARRLT